MRVDFKIFWTLTWLSCCSYRIIWTFTSKHEQFIGRHTHKDKTTRTRILTLTHAVTLYALDSLHCSTLRRSTKESIIMFCCHYYALADQSPSVFDFFSFKAAPVICHVRNLFMLSSTVDFFLCSLPMLRSIIRLCSAARRCLLCFGQRQVMNGGLRWRWWMPLSRQSSGPPPTGHARDYFLLAVIWISCWQLLNRCWWQGLVDC